jgi:hypothetical protein
MGSTSNGAVNGQSFGLAFAGTVSGSNLSGTANVTSGAGYITNGATGPIKGAFFGPGANEVGFTWQVADGTNKAIGVLGAAR